MDKDNLEAMRGLAQNLSNDNQLEASLEQFKAVQEADPQDATASLRISEIYRRMGKLDLAMQNLKKAESLVQDLALKSRITKPSSWKARASMTKPPRSCKSS